MGDRLPLVPQRVVSANAEDFQAPIGIARDRGGLAVERIVRSDRHTGQPCEQIGIGRRFAGQRLVVGGQGGATSMDDLRDREAERAQPIDINNTAVGAGGVSVGVFCRCFLSC